MEEKIPVGRAKDLTGQKFGSLTVLYRVKNLKNRNARWHCRCDCGRECDIESQNLQKGTFSCGCNRGGKLNLMGQRFGMWTVINYAPNKKQQTAWLCRCDCGTERIVTTNSLRQGESQSCGCQKGKNQIINLTGQRFGSLVVIGIAEGRSTNGRVWWECACDCGNMCTVEGHSLKSGLTTSCGCARGKDLLGQKFGLLTVIEKTSERDVSGSIIWRCKCDCGNIVKVNSTRLVSGQTTSCGCKRQGSSGEIKITKLLTSHGVPFQREKTFESCRYPDTGGTPRFDFFINNSYIVEFDGYQHIQNTPSEWFSQEALDKIKQHDKYKNDWCKQNKIPLIRIPYSQLKKLTIEDLIPSSSKFLIK